VSEGFTPAAARALLLSVGGSEATSSSERIALAIEQVWVQLAHHFGRLIGAGGIQALQDRSVSVAAKRLPWLSVPLHGSEVAAWSLVTVFERRPATEAVAELAHVMDSLLTLLGRLIGDALVETILHEMWPDVFPRRAKELA